MLTHVNIMFSLQIWIKIYKWGIFYELNVNTKESVYIYVFFCFFFFFYKPGYNKVMFVGIMSKL